MRLLICLIVLLPLLIGTNGPCPEPNRPSLEDCPFPVDPALVQGELLGWLEIPVGKQMAHTRTWCDPDGDSARAEIIAGPEGARLINKPRLNAYTLLWTPTRLTTTAFVVRVTDNPVVGTPASSVGTLLIHVIPAARRSPSGGCGGQPR